MFTRIDPDHPLTQAAREVNSRAESESLNETIEWLGIDVSFDQLAYLAHQRALRAIFAARGVNLNSSHFEAVSLTENEEALLPILTASYLDGIAIGWRGKALQVVEEKGRRS
jgi:hypothetical protein